MNKEKTLLERLGSDVFYGDARQWNMHKHNTLHMEAINHIRTLESENKRLREAIASIANSINVVGSPYHKAQEALDLLVIETKKAAREALIPN